MTLDTPNQHCLDKVIKLAEQQPVTALQDIYDAHGVKLWAKGVPVSRELQEKLLRRKLAKPLESSLMVERAVSFAEIMDDCLRQLDQDPRLQKISGSREARALLSEAKAIPLPPPLRLLLTSVKENDPESYTHTLQVAVVCAGIAAKLTASASDTNTLLMSAILHDIGEMYINPEYLSAKRMLEPHEWKHVVSHPRIGQLLIKELTSLPAAVGQCIGQHHERHDGSGYPFQHQRADQHRLSGWIAVADSTAALLTAGGDGAAARISLALRIVPGEYDRDAAGVLIQALHQANSEYGVHGDSDCIAKARDDLHKLETVQNALIEVAASTDLPFIKQTCDAAGTLLRSIAKAMRATGVLDANMLGDSINDPELLAEMHLILREVRWRTRNLARNLYLRAESQPGPEALASLADIIAQMSG